MYESSNKVCIIDSQPPMIAGVDPGWGLLGCEPHQFTEYDGIIIRIQTLLYCGVFHWHYVNMPSLLLTFFAGVSTSSKFVCIKV